MGFGYNSSVIILEPNNGIAKAVRNYYLLTVGCSLGIVLGVFMFGGVCVLLVRFERERKRKEARKAAAAAKKKKQQQQVPKKQ